MKRYPAFDKLAGQERVKFKLMQFIEQGCLPHALIMEGIKGIGKTTAAFALARSSICRKRCEEKDLCDDCKHIIKKNHPDVRFYKPEKKGAGGLLDIEKKSSKEASVSKVIKIEQARDIQRTASMAPSFSDKKFIILKPAEALSLESANALLKTLEEPPPSTHFILITEHPDRLLSTIISRCMRIKFRPLPEDVIRDLLDLEQDIKNPGRVAEAVSLAGGSFLFARDHLNSDDDLSERLLNVLKTLPSVSHKEILETAELLAKKKDRVNEWFRVILIFFHDISCYLGAGGHNSRAVYTTHVKFLMNSLAHRLNISKVLALCNRIMEYERYLERNINDRAVLEMLLFNLKEGLTSND